MALLRARRAADALPAAGWRHAAVLVTVVASFVAFVIGVLRFHWDFDQLSAVFFIMGVVAGLDGGLKLAGTAEAFVDGFRSMAFAALLIGFARGIYVVLSEGRIVDTVVHGIFTPIADLPVTVSALGMMAAHLLIHVPVPSTSGQAVLTLPLLVPLSDLIGLSRQVTVLAYQYGAGLGNLLWPTNGALMAMLAASGVRYEDWLRFTLPLVVLLAGLERRGDHRRRDGGVLGDTGETLHLFRAGPDRRGGAFPLPCWNTIRVGMPRMPRRAAVAGFASVSILRTSTSPVCRRAKSSSTGAIILQGPHQSA